MKHLKIGGSKAARIIQCPGHLERAERLPKQGSSIYADRGNLLHDAMENFYSKDLDFDDMVGKLTYANIILEEEHRAPFNIAINATENVLEDLDIEDYMCEPFVQYEEDVIGGSIDMLGVSTDRETVLILDYKFGSIAVSPHLNHQLMFYAMCAKADDKTAGFFAECKKVVLCIIQPEVSKSAVIYTATLKQLNEFTQLLLDAIESTDIKPGPECRYCPAATVCPEQKQQAVSALAMDPKTAEEVSEALVLANELDAWVKNVKGTAYSLAKNGSVLPGFKLVHGRSLRRWKLGAEESVLNILGQQAYTQKLVSPAQAEKLTEEDLTVLIEKPPGKPTLAPESDKRVAISEVILPENLTKGFTTK